MGFGKDGKGVIFIEARGQSIGTLASLTPLLIGTNAATLERYRMIKLEMKAVIQGVTPTEMLGMWIGIADGDLSLTEIEEAIELTAGPLGPNDTINDALAERFVKFLGCIRDDQAGGEVVFTNENGGCMLEAVIRWTFARTKSWNYFLYNMGVAPTAGGVVNIRVKSFGVWVL